MEAQQINGHTALFESEDRGSPPKMPSELPTEVASGRDGDLLTALSVAVQDVLQLDSVKPEELVGALREHKGELKTLRRLRTQLTNDNQTLREKLKTVSTNKKETSDAAHRLHAKEREVIRLANQVTALTKKVEGAGAQDANVQTWNDATKVWNEATRKVQAERDALMQENQTLKSEREHYMQALANAQRCNTNLDRLLDEAGHEQKTLIRAISRLLDK